MAQGFTYPNKIPRVTLTPIDTSHLTTPNQTSEVLVPSGATGIVFSLQGTYAGSIIDFYVSADSGNSYQTVEAVRMSDGYIAIETPTNTNSYETWYVSVIGQTNVRLQIIAITSGQVDTAFYAVFTPTTISGEQVNIGKVTYGAQVTGSITASAQTVGLRTNGYTDALFSINGTYGSVAIIFEASDDSGVTYYTVQALRGGSSTIETASGTISNTSRFWFVSFPGATNFRVRATAWTSGTASIRITPIGAGEAMIATVQGAVSALQSGTWNIGTVTTLTGITNTVTVSGSVSISSVTLTSSSTSLGKMSQTATYAAANDILVGMAAVRKDGTCSLTTTDGTYTPLQVTALGQLKVDINSQGLASVQTKKRSSNRADTYTVTGNGVTVDMSTNPVMNYAIAVKGTGAAATTWDIRLEGSLDNTNFTQILQHTNTTGDGLTLFSATNDSPALYFRSRCAGLVLGGATNVVVTILGIE